MPQKNPVTAGRNARRPRSAERFMDGIRSDHTDAATMTPDAKPRRPFSTFCRIPFLIKYTHAAPSVVPANGIRIPRIIFPIFSIVFYLL